MLDFSFFHRTSWTEQGTTVNSYSRKLPCTWEWEFWLCLLEFIRFRFRLLIWWVAQSYLFSILKHSFFYFAGAVIPNTCEPIYANIPPDLKSICQNQQIPDDECANFIQIMNGNSLAAFGAITADAFTADFQVLATSGSGISSFSNLSFCNSLGLHLKHWCILTK